MQCQVNGSKNCFQCNINLSLREQEEEKYKKNEREKKTIVEMLNQQILYRLRVNRVCCGLRYFYYVRCVCVCCMGCFNDMAMVFHLYTAHKDTAYRKYMPFSVQRSTRKKQSTLNQ